MREVLSSAAEAELGALFVNGKESCPIRLCLEDLGHNQPPTPMQTNNNTASGIANDTVKQKRSKAIDMRFYWIRDRTRHGHFYIHWKPGEHQYADYHTMHHLPTVHRELRQRYLHTEGEENKTKNDANFERVC